MLKNVNFEVSVDIDVVTALNEVWDDKRKRDEAIKNLYHSFDYYQDRFFFGEAVSDEELADMKTIYDFLESRIDGKITDADLDDCIKLNKNINYNGIDERKGIVEYVFPLDIDVDKIKDKIQAISKIYENPLQETFYVNTLDISNSRSGGKNNKTVEFTTNLDEMWKIYEGIDERLKEHFPAEHIPTVMEINNLMLKNYKLQYDSDGSENSFEFLELVYKPVVDAINEGIYEIEKYKTNQDIDGSYINGKYGISTVENIFKCSPLINRQENYFLRTLYDSLMETKRQLDIRYECLKDGGSLPYKEEKEEEGIELD
jgi:hypothetical protein